MNCDDDITHKGRGGGGGGDGANGGADDDGVLVLFTSCCNYTDGDAVRPRQPNQSNITQ